MKLIIPLLLSLSCSAQVPVWICIKEFKPYYQPGDYEVWKIKQPGEKRLSKDTVYITDTLYIDSCRLRHEALPRVDLAIPSLPTEIMIKETLVRNGKVVKIIYQKTFSLALGEPRRVNTPKGTVIADSIKYQIYIP